MSVRGKCLPPGCQHHHGVWQADHGVVHGTGSFGCNHRTGLSFSCICEHLLVPFPALSPRARVGPFCVCPALACRKNHRHVCDIRFTMPLNIIMTQSCLRAHHPHRGLHQWRCRCCFTSLPFRMYAMTIVFKAYFRKDGVVSL